MVHPANAIKLVGGVPVGERAVKPASALAKHETRKWAVGCVEPSDRNGIRGRFFG
jgi:hypothetical protein